MRKIGPVIIIISALFNLFVSTIILLYVYDAFNTPSWLKWISKQVIDHDKLKTRNIIKVVIAIIQISLAFFAIRKPRGISAVIILAMSMIQVAFYVYEGLDEKFTTSIIVPLTISSVASLSMVYGLFISKNKD